MIRSRESEDRQYNDQKEKDKNTIQMISTKHNPETKTLSNMYTSENRGYTRLYFRGKKFLPL